MYGPQARWLRTWLCAWLAALLLLGGIPMKPAGAAAPANESVSIMLGASPEEHGIQARAGDGSAGPVTGEVQGRTYWQTNKSQVDEERILYFYMNVDDDFSVNMSAYDVQVSVDYYDSGNGKMVLQYDAQGADKSFKDAPLYTYGDTGTWKTQTFKLSDANFANRTGGSDFRIGIEGGGASWGSNADLKVASVTVTKTLKGTSADEASIVLGPTPIERGITACAGDNADGLVTGTLDGKGYWRTNQEASGDRTLYLYMNVDDGFLYDNKDQDVYVTVEYKDTGSGSFVLQYDALSSAFKNSPLYTYKNSGVWKKQTFQLSDAKFANGTNGADFRIGISGGGNPANNPDLFVASVTVKKVQRHLTTSQTRVHETVNATSDVVIADFSVAEFGVKGDGIADDTKAFQDALDAAGNNGGGVVFAPAGHYRIMGSLLIPTGVTLRGDWAAPKETGAGPATGTVLEAYAGRGQEDGTSFIRLQPVSGVTNLAIWYPEQSLQDPTAYPWTLEQLSGDSATMENLTLVNSYNGIKIGPVWNELHDVKQVYGAALKTGIFLDYTTDIGRLEGIHLSPSYWSGSGLAGAPEGSELLAYSQAHAEGIVMGRSDWEYMSDISISGFKNGMSVTTRTGSIETANAQMFRIHIEHCNTALRIEGVNDFGLLITDSSFRADAGTDPVAIYATEGFHSIVQFNTVAVGGSPQDAVRSEGNGVISFENSTFENWNDAQGGYAINLKGGSLTLGQSDFAKAVKQVKLSGPVQTVHALNSGHGSDPLQVTNESEGADVRVTKDARYTLEPLPAIGDTDLAAEPKPATKQLFDVTAAPYLADRNGGNDASGAIQQALDAAGAAGGGTVYLPAGIYRVDSPITVPGGVELRGSWDVPHHTIGGGSVLFTRYGENPGATTPALITLQASAGIRGLSVYYDEQDWNSVKPYAWTIQGQGHGVYAIDTTLINPYQGIDFGSYDTSGHYIDYVAGSPLKEGIFLGGGSTGGMMRNVQFNPHYYGRNNYINHPSTDADFDKVWSYQKENLDTFNIGDVHGETIFNTFVYGSQYGIHFAKQGSNGPEAVIIGHGTDGSKKGVYIEGAGASGVSFLNTELVSLSTTDKVYVTTGEAFDSTARFYNSSMWGDTMRSVDILGPGKVLIQQSNFTTVGERGIQALAGNVALYDSYFQQPRTTHVYASADISKLVVSNNLFKGGLQLVNEAGAKVSGSDLVPAALHLTRNAPDTGHKEKPGSQLELTNISSEQALGGKLELVQPASYATRFVPVRFSGLGYGESRVIDLPYVAADTLKFRVTLDNGTVYLSSVKLGQSFASRADSGANSGSDGGSNSNSNVNADSDAGPSSSSGTPVIEVASPDQYSGGLWHGIDDLSAQANVRWDDEKLYVDVDVRDNVQEQSFKGGDIWQGDSIQLGIDLSRDKGAASRNVSELGFALNNDGSITKWRWKAPDGLAAGALDAATTADITRDNAKGITHYVLAIPFNQLQGSRAAYTPGQPIGFSLLMNENDGAGRAGFMEYNQGIGTSKDFTLYGDLELLSGLFTDWTVPSAETEVAKALKKKDVTTVDAAWNFVNVLPDGADKSRLSGELKALSDNGNGNGNGSGNGNGNGNGGGTFTPLDDSGTAVLKASAILDTASSLAKATVTVEALNTAYGQATASPDGVKRVRIEVSEVAGALGYSVELPKSALDGSQPLHTLEIVTPEGILTLEGTMLGKTTVTENMVTLVIRNSDRSKWSAGLKARISGHPAVDLFLQAGGRIIPWSNPDSPVTVALPYKPAADEAADTGRLIILYVEDNGQASAVLNGRFDPKKGQMIFRTAHFSTYAAAYADAVAFKDLDSYAWAKQAIEALAARGVVNGLSADTFAPEQSIKRADFLLLLMKTLDLAAPASGSDTASPFHDVKPGSYYEQAVTEAAAKGIVKGADEGLFNPDARISRQDAAVMIDRALQAAKTPLPEAKDSVLSGFSDRSRVADYARPSVQKLVQESLLQGSGGNLSPAASLSRAESAVLLYRLYNR